MTSKTYHATSMSEALAEVKRDLGRDAIILHTRTVRKGRWLSLRRRRSVWEVTASANVNVTSPLQDIGETAPATTPQEAASSTDADIASVSAARSAEVGSPAKLDRISQMLEMLVSGRSAQQGSELSCELQYLHDHLCDQDVNESIATELIAELQMSMTGQELAEQQVVHDRLTDLIAARIPTASVSEPQQQSARGRVIALVGPTGVGKTTTIAKLAANMKLRQHKRVGLITIDTYRIAAVDQLKTYADIIDVPLRTVLSAKEMGQAIYAMRGMDAILIDTVGRSQNDKLRLNELRGFLSAADADEVHLVISATANRRCADSVVARFRPLGASRLILTKLDEAEAFGMALNISAAADLPLSYVSTGQEVPDDIALADASELAARIMSSATSQAVGGLGHDC